MAEPFLSEIRLFSFNFAPKGWAFCNGQFLPINQNQALFSLLGTTYGGNGQTNFALPEPARPRAPCTSAAASLSARRPARVGAHDHPCSRCRTHTPFRAGRDANDGDVADPGAAICWRSFNNGYRTRRAT